MHELEAEVPEVPTGSRRQARHRGLQVPRASTPNAAYTQFEDKPAFDEVEVLANRYLDEYVTGKIDRLDVVYTRFDSVAQASRPWSKRCCRWARSAGDASRTRASEPANRMYEFLPSAESILEEVVPASFKVKLFKCFLDAAVSEQIARMVAMKAATENAGEIDQAADDDVQPGPPERRSPARSWKSSAASRR